MTYVTLGCLSFRREKEGRGERKPCSQTSSWVSRSGKRRDLDQTSKVFFFLHTKKRRKKKEGGQMVNAGLVLSQTDSGGYR